MALLLDAGPSAAVIARGRGEAITIGLVNNMPDTAWEATERQFLALVRAAAGKTPVKLQLFSLTDLPRADHIRAELAERYRDLSALLRTRLDGLIVTGTEPRAANLEDEPYWASLATLIDWARHNTVSTIWSCLAAHAAVLHADGIERHPLAEKQFGVFDCEAVSPDPLTDGAGSRLMVPHSRWNDLSAAALTACGYRILTRSAAAGVDMFAAPQRHGDALFLLLQGHPEYEPGTLLREYRRDIGRFLRGEQAHYPAAPQGYFDAEALAQVSAFRARTHAERRADLLADFPMRALEAGLDARWQRSAVGLYQKWLDYLAERKADRRTMTIAPQRPPRRDWPAAAMRQAAEGSSAG
jgi:homoserine O-succinyltransferase/O-acetyltransferase